MKHWGFSSLAMRIWVTFTAMILVISICISLAFYLILYTNEQQARLDEAKLARELAQSKNQLDVNAEAPLYSQAEHFILRKMEKDRIAIVSTDPSAKTDLQETAPDLVEVLAGLVKEGNLGQVPVKIDYNGNEYTFRISPVEGIGPGSNYLVSYVDSSHNNFLGIAVLICILFVWVGFITSKIVANNILRPLEALEEYTGRIAQKDWTVPMSVKRRDEIGRLAESMNNMQETLKRSEAEEKLFLQSISHDLKTPVMVIMSHAQAILDGVHVASTEETAMIIRDEAERLEKKIRQILYLNSLEYALEHNNENQEVDLEALVQEIVKKMRPIRGDICWQLDTIRVSGCYNPDKIRVAVENILDNQLRYAKGVISITLREEDDLKIIEIFNDGVRIDPDKLKHIFEAFYKDRTGNFGLGLAISKKIIDFYKGSLFAENRDDGVAFLIKLP